MSTASPKRRFRYKYRDLEGEIFGPFDAEQMADWYERGLLDESLLIFRIAFSGEMKEFELKELKKTSEKPFHEIDEPEVPKVAPGPLIKNCEKRSTKKLNSELYTSLPFLRLPDPGSTLIKSEDSKAKIFSLYQLIITVPRSLSHFPPYDQETVCCQFCDVILVGKAMFTHLVDIQHLEKMSSCVFSEEDVDFWIQRVQNVIKMAPADALTLPGFEPKIFVKNPSTVAQFLRRNTSITKLQDLGLNRHTKPFDPQTNFIKVALDKVYATHYSVNRHNKTKRKLTGLFLCDVVEQLLKRVNREQLDKQYGFLIRNFNKCTFCNKSLSSFYELCVHVASRPHRNQTEMMLFHEGTVGRWVRLLSFSTQECENSKQNPSEADSEVVIID